MLRQANQLIMVFEALFHSQSIQAKLWWFDFVSFNATEFHHFWFSSRTVYLWKSTHFSQIDYLNCWTSLTYHPIAKLRIESDILTWEKQQSLYNTKTEKQQNCNGLFFSFFPRSTHFSRIDYLKCYLNCNQQQNYDGCICVFHRLTLFVCNQKMLFEFSVPNVYLKRIMFLIHISKLCTKDIFHINHVFKSNLNLDSSLEFKNKYLKIHTKWPLELPN